MDLRRAANSSLMMRLRSLTVTEAVSLRASENLGNSYCIDRRPCTAGLPNLGMDFDSS